MPSPTIPLRAARRLPEFPHHRIPTPAATENENLHNQRKFKVRGRQGNLSNQPHWYGLTAEMEWHSGTVQDSCANDPASLISFWRMRFRGFVDFASISRSKRARFEEASCRLRAYSLPPPFYRRFSPLDQFSPSSALGTSSVERDTYSS